MKTKQCVGCGFCCTVRPCSYAYSYAKKTGEDPSLVWDGSKCIYLNDDDSCGIYAAIKVWDDSLPENMRMFDCGCSSSLFNDRRDKKLLDLSTEQ